MLDLYLEGLVKEASAKKHLDSHLEELVKKANEQAELEAALEKMSVGELAKLAGFKLAEETCTKCGAKMEKLGKMYKCGCGMMKGAQAPMPKEEPPPESKDEENETPMGAEEEESEPKEKDAKATCAEAKCASRQQLKKEALIHAPIIGALSADPGQRGKGALGGAGGGVVGGILGTPLGALLGAGVGSLRNRAEEGAYIGRILGALGGSSYGAYLGGKAVGRAPAEEVTPEEGPEKTSALFQVGDAAGRLMAKAAAGPGIFTPVFDQEELEEAAQEAQSREDIPGRARRSALAGGGIGALGGAALGIGGGLLAKRLGLPAAGSLPALAGLGTAGAAGGGYLGARLGKRYGAEEAAADKVYAMLRQQKALQAGAQMGAQQGYMAGAQRGYLAGLRQARSGAPMAKQGAVMEGAKRILGDVARYHPEALGAGAGALAGAGIGAGVADEGSRLRGALTGAGIGGLGGAGVGAISRLSRTAGMQNLGSEMRKNPKMTMYAMEGAPMTVRQATAEQLLAGAPMKTRLAAALKILRQSGA